MKALFFLTSLIRTNQLGLANLVFIFKNNHCAHMCKIIQYNVIKNRTYVKKVGHTLELLFDIYWWTWKNNYLSKNCYSGPIKNVIISIFTLLYFFIACICFFYCFFFVCNFLKKNKGKHVDIPSFYTWVPNIGKFYFAMHKKRIM